MATRQKLQEEFLTCIICHELFRDPVTLSCGHHFCAECVTTYTKTQPDAIAQQSIRCPHCRCLTKIPNAQTPLEHWTSQIKTGFFIRNLVEAFGSGAEAEDGEMCSVCGEDGEAKPATHWCTNCSGALCLDCREQHRRHAKTHEVCDLKRDNSDLVQKARKPATCPEHPDACVDMMCEDHDVAACQRCCIIYHRKCDSVITLKQAMTRITAVLETREKQLKAKTDELKKQKSEKKTQAETIEKDAAEAERGIRESGRRLAAVIKKKEDQLVEQLKAVKGEALQQLEGEMKSLSQSIQMDEQNHGILMQAMKSTSDPDRYEIYKASPSDIPFPAAVDNSMLKIEFVNNFGEVTKYMENARLGDINMCEKKQADPSQQPRDHKSAASSLPQHPVMLKPKTADKSVSKATFRNKIHTKLPGETSKSSIRDVLVMDVSDSKVIIVTDLYNQNIKAFYHEKNQQHHSCLSTGQSLWGLTKISATRGAATVPGSKEIIIFHVTPDLKLDKKIKTREMYWGLTQLSPTILAASTRYLGASNHVDIIDMSGTVLRSFGSGTVIYPEYMCTSPTGDILVSDCGHNQVVCFSDHGDVRFTYKLTGNRKLQYPLGVSCSRSGDIFVADKNAHKVIQLTPEGKFVKDILTSQGGISEPRGLYIDDDNIMYVSQSDEYVSVYLLQ